MTHLIDRLNNLKNRTDRDYEFAGGESQRIYDKGQIDILEEILSLRSPERIICAAIWVKALPKATHNPFNITEGLVIGGLRHCHCIQALVYISKDSAKMCNDQGFITNTNRYVSREEAAKIAYNAGQTEKLHDILFSEDLY